MKKHEKNLSMLLSEELPNSQLAMLTGGRGDGDPITPPHDLVTPDGDDPHQPYTPDDPDPISN